MDILLWIVKTIWDGLWDWPMGTIISSLFILAFGAIMVIILGYIFIAFDSLLLPRKWAQGSVVAKRFTPAHTQVMWVYNAALKMSQPFPVTTPDQWWACVQVDGKEDCISVNKTFFNSLIVGKCVQVEYVIGRISRKLYVKALSRT